MPTTRSRRALRWCSSTPVPAFIYLAPVRLSERACCLIVVLSSTTKVWCTRDPGWWAASRRNWWSSSSEMASAPSRTPSVTITTKRWRPSDHPQRGVASSEFQAFLCPFLGDKAPFLLFLFFLCCRAVAQPPSFPLPLLSSCVDSRASVPQGPAAPSPEPQFNRHPLRPTTSRLHSPQFFCIRGFDRYIQWRAYRSRP